MLLQGELAEPHVPLSAPVLGLTLMMAALVSVASSANARTRRQLVRYDDDDVFNILGLSLSS